MAGAAVKIVLTVPASHADAVRHAMGDAGAGRLGPYGHCSFSARGTGRYVPLPGADPYDGEVGKLSEVEEERIEVTCERSCLQQVLAAIRRVHPYEQPAVDVYPLEDAPLPPRPS